MDMRYVKEKNMPLLRARIQEIFDSVLIFRITMKKIGVYGISGSWSEEVGAEIFSDCEFVYETIDAAIIERYGRWEDDLFHCSC